MEDGRRDSLGMIRSADSGTAAAILRVARDGDQTAWAWLVERHAARMLAVAEAITGERSLAEDAVQEALIAISSRATRRRLGARTVSAPAGVGTTS
jgi:DNA-directed RNA polymerase specialized sigma24 family protein